MIKKKIFLKRKEICLQFVHVKVAQYTLCKKTTNYNFYSYESKKKLNFVIVTNKGIKKKTTTKTKL